MKAILIDKSDDKYSVRLTELKAAQLPKGDVTVAVEYSTLNYKDSLALTGAAPIVRKFPMVPGIDLAGTVTDSDHSGFAVGDRVLLNGYGVGERHWGGLAQQARVRGDWLVPVPEAFSTHQAMAIGTAGYTAMLCVMALEKHGLTPDRGPVLVTGAAGGVGSVAVALLAKLGHRVIASTGRPSEADYLTALGASEILPRTELSKDGMPMGKERWAGAVDAVGSHTLANVCAMTMYGGAVAACGLAQGPDLETTVLPFILRGISLLGIDSVQCPHPLRLEAWRRLAADLNPDLLAAMTTDIALSDAIATAGDQLDGRTRGRPVVDVNA